MGRGWHAPATAATVVLFLALALTVPPERWLDVHCDALSLNLAVLAAITTAGLWVAIFASPKRSIRFLVLGASTVVGGAIYAAFEPACLAGPYGQLNPALKPIWLDHVMETKSLFWLGASEPTTALAAVAFIFAGVVAQIVLWNTKRDVGMGLAAAFVLLASALGCWQLRLLPYAGWLAAVSLAIWAARLPGTASLSAPVIRLAVIVLLSHATLDVSLSVFRSSTSAGDTPFEAAARPILLPIRQRPQSCYFASRFGSRGHRSRTLYRRVNAAPRRGRALPSTRQGHPCQRGHPAWHARASHAAPARPRSKLRGAVCRSSATRHR